MNPVDFRRGFLPAVDPATRFERFPEFGGMCKLGAALPDLLAAPDFRAQAAQWPIPLWPENVARAETLPELRLYYLTLGFLASGYVNQVGQPPVALLPRNLAVPLCRACQLLERPPILSYDGYALYNWRRLDPAGPIALGNLDTLQNFVRLYDEKWFILVHVEIEAIAGDILAAMDRAAEAMWQRDGDTLDECLTRIAAAVWRQVAVLRRIPERMSPELYFKTFRPYIRFFENVVFEGVNAQPLNYRGETGAQSSVLPALVAFLKIRHRQSLLTTHLRDMRRFMPREHQAVLTELEALPSPRELASPDAYNAAIDAVAAFREVHFGWAQEYINRHVTDPRGTGGTPYMQWLQQLIAETHEHRITAGSRQTDQVSAPTVLPDIRLPEHVQRV
ncbi:hypothetical protein GC176_26340 [bacterium]|nr:hypothetical protein [bacterium]